MRKKEFDIEYIQEIDYALDQLSKLEGCLKDLYLECPRDDSRNKLISNCLQSLFLTSKIMFIALNYEDYDL